VHALDVDPADGSLYVAGHLGVFKVTGRDGDEAVEVIRVADRWQDTMAFTVTGPGRFLASGHPDLREDLPVHLGLIESTDAARTWRPVSLQGSADFHALEVAGTTVYGYDAITGRLRLSTDGGATWDRGAKTDVADLAVDPVDPRRLWATRPSGGLLQFDYDDPPGSPQPVVVPGPPLVNLDWPTADLVLGVAADGAVHRSGDRGRTWHRIPGPPGDPEAITTAGRFWYVATTTGLYSSTDEGRTWDTLLSHES
jgi:photosystem II stability/assembly factor-like uncharacterized protein